MGWYVRRSVRMGPVRWNISKRGIGVSAGVKGLRVGVGPRGPYVAGGRGGLYFRQGLGKSRKSQAKRPPASLWFPSPQSGRLPGAVPQYPQYVQTPPAPPVAPAMAPVQYLPETQIADYSAATTDQLVQHIATQRSNVAFFPWAVVGMVVVQLILLEAFWPLLIVTIPASIFGAIYLRRLDYRRTHVTLTYDLDSAEQQQYQNLCNGLASLALVARLQRVEARQIHGDWKHHGGATSALQLESVAALPPGQLRWLDTNVPLWAICWRQGQLTLIFLPDRVLVEQGRQMAAIPYSDVRVDLATGRFVESGAPPADAQIVGYNWLYANKSGGPDRRFSNNRQLPVLNESYITLSSSSGLNLQLQASNNANASAFAQSLRTFRPLLSANPPALL